MERLFFGTITGCFLAIITINTHGILSTQNKTIKSINNNDSGRCFLLSRRECQNKTASHSPSTSEGPTNPLPSSLPLSISGTGSPSTSTNGGA